MEILTVAIQKGGTGKTTTAAALAQAAAHRGKKVLAIDLDPQGNFTFALGYRPNKHALNSYSLLTGAAPAQQPIAHTADNISMIGAAWELQTIKTEPGSARRLQKAIEPLKKDYDVIIIDTPPTAGELQYNALQAATGLVIPLQANIYNLQSLYQIAETAKQIQNSNPALSIRGFVLTQYDSRSTIAKQMQQTITDTAAAMGIPCLGVIRNGIAIQEAAALQQSLFEYAPKSKPAADYMALYEALNI